MEAKNKTISLLHEVNTELKFDKQELDKEIRELKAENKELKNINEGIMNEPGTGHIQGSNGYEKFCQVMSELNYDEKWITELKENQLTD